MNPNPLLLITGEDQSGLIYSQDDHALIAACQFFVMQRGVSLLDPAQAQAHAQRIVACVNLLWHLTDAELSGYLLAELPKGTHYEPVIRRNRPQAKAPSIASLKVHRPFPLLPDRVENALLRAGILSVEDLEWHTEQQLLKKPDIGEYTIIKIREHYHLSDEESEPT